MRISLQLVLAALTAGAALTATAQPIARIDTPAIDARQAHQELRIERGVARGELTRREARELRIGQRQIARTEARPRPTVM